MPAKETRRGEAVLRAVGFAAERFLGETAGWEESIEEVLERLGVAMEVSRVYVFENYVGEDGEVWGVRRYEWVAPGDAARADDPLMEDIPYRGAGYGRWVELWERGEVVHGHTREFPEAERPELEAQGVLSVAIVPVFVAGRWWGQIGFDECLAEREWSATEIDALKAVAGTLGAAIERRRTEEDPRRSEARYRAIIEQAADGVYLLDPAAGRVLETNPALQKMLGYAAGELRGMQIHDFDAHAREDVVIRRALKRRLVGERKYRRKDGTLLDVEVDVSAISYGKDVVCTTVRDIAERKRTEEASKQSEQLYRAVIEQATENIFLVDVETKRIVQSNPAFREALGYSEEELKRMTLYDVVDADRESVDRNVRKIVELKSPSVGERGYRRKDGSLLDVEVSASTILLDGRKTLCVVAHDVTERKRAEEELRESQRTLLTLMSNLPGMAYRCRNDPDWTMEFVSEGCLELTGYPSVDLIANRVRAYGDLIHADDADPVWTDVQAALEEQRPFQIAYRITTASGTEKWVWEQGRGIFSNEGELLALEGFITDVSERVRAFEMLEQRVAALSRISADLTLDLPMASALDVLAEGVVRASSAVACAVVLVDEEAGTLRPVGSHELPEGYEAGLETAYRAGARPPTQDAFRHAREPLLVRDVRKLILDDGLYAPIHRFAGQVPWDVAYIVPLVFRGRILGAIHLYYLPDEEPGEDERVFLGGVADQTAVAVENARLFAQASDKAALEERQRLARELHDSVSQALYGIVLSVKSARTLLDIDPVKAADLIDYVHSLGETGMTEMRALIFELRPESLEKEGLVAALEKQAAALRARHEIEVEATLCDEPEAPLSTKEAVYRVVQEALHNIVKHARASKARPSMGCDRERITLEVLDDGAGFDAGGDFPGHLGLRSMRERASRLGGTLEVESAAGRGTRIRARIPV